MRLSEDFAILYKQEINQIRSITGACTFRFNNVTVGESSIDLCDVTDATDVDHTYVERLSCDHGS